MIRYVGTESILSATTKESPMDWKIELVAIPVSDVDRAKAFYAEKVGFNADHDHRVSDTMRFVQLTPPGSACSITIGEGISEAAPGVGPGHADGRRRRQSRPI
jgi:catechol 2,3-dioxygenase-like lactoylglutathione lyase family enzyme